MNVKCGINGESRHVSQIFLCHHCGMPVCEEHGWVVAADDAFADTAVATQAPGRPADPAPAAPGPRFAVTVRRPAMHCRECMERSHKGAPRRHGWADPRPQAAGVAGPAGRP